MLKRHLAVTVKKVTLILRFGLQILRKLVNVCWEFKAINNIRINRTSLASFICGFIRFKAISTENYVEITR